MVSCTDEWDKVLSMLIYIDELGFLSHAFICYIIISHHMLASSENYAVQYSDFVKLSVRDRPNQFLALTFYAFICRL